MSNSGRSGSVNGLAIGINALYLIPGQVGGTEIYLRSLLAALAEIDTVNRYYVFTNRETGPDLVPRQPNFIYERQPIRGSFRPGRLLWEQSGLVWMAWRRRLDVLLNAGFTAPILTPCPMVTVFHDLQHKRHPEFFRKFELPFWNFFLWAAAHRSATLLAAAESTVRDLVRCYNLSKDKIRMVEYGVDPHFFEIRARRRPETLQPYVLCVSTLHPHKNLDRLLQAFVAFHRANPRYQLVIAGMRGYQSRELERRISELALGDAVRLTGWIPREELYQLYEHAAIFVYPSCFEGFGLPVLEALAAGIPTVCSAIEPLRRLAGSAALLFDPQDRHALADALLQLASDEALRARLEVAGPEQAAHFSWRETAQKTLAVLRRTANYRSQFSS